MSHTDLVSSQRRVTGSWARCDEEEDADAATGAAGDGGGEPTTATALSGGGGGRRRRTAAGSGSGSGSDDDSDSDARGIARDDDDCGIARLPSVSRLLPRCERLALDEVGTWDLSR